MTLKAAAFTAWEDWTRITGDTALFTPLLTAIYQKHSIPFDGIAASMPATNAVFRIGTTVAKIYMPHADGSIQDKETERIALHEAAVRGVPAPKILAHGVEDGFPYLITGFIEGQTFAAAEPHTTAAEKEAFGQQLRAFTDRLNQPSAPFNSIDVLHDADRQERWEIYPAQFQAERRAWISGHDFGRHILVHGD
ncbi:MAG: phosphotransferase, partial [Clostridia bacterium]|nr:phosphotransferase [Clostridia bacterium]